MPEVLGMSGPYSLDQINENMRVSAEAGATSGNAMLAKNYESAVSNWKQNRDAGYPGPIPVPEKGFRVYKDASGWWTIAQDGPLVAPIYVEEGAPVVPMLVAIGAAIPGMPGCFSRGYVNGVPDNTPNGYVAQPWGAGGPKFVKIVEPSPFGFTAYYRMS